MANKGNEEVSPSRKKRCVQARDQRDDASRPTNKQGADRVTGMCNRSKPTRKRDGAATTSSQQRTRGTRRGGLEECEMQTIGARGGISAQVREAVRGRELAQTERAREQLQRERRGKRATSEQQQPERGKNQREDFPAKITSCPDLLPPNTKQRGQYRMWNDHAVRSRELQQICLQSYRREQVRIVQPPFHNSHLATLKESTDREREKHRADAVLS